MRDLVLEGAQGHEVETLRALSLGETGVSKDVTLRLKAKGWIDTYGDTALVTLAGRTLLDRH